MLILTLLIRLPSVWKKSDPYAAKADIEKISKKKGSQIQ
jgi:hypothetical protein